VKNDPLNEHLRDVADFLKSGKYGDGIVRADFLKAIMHHVGEEETNYDELVLAVSTVLVPHVLLGTASQKATAVYIDALAYSLVQDVKSLWNKVSHKVDDKRETLTSLLIHAMTDEVLFMAFGLPSDEDDLDDDEDDISTEDDPVLH
jgi:hypothetical protein